MPAKKDTIKKISAKAKEIWKKEKGEKWTDAIKRASALLKKEGKI
jgi:hypothetical protein